jgi:hypothetical protein
MSVDRFQFIFVVSELIGGTIGELTVPELVVPLTPLTPPCAMISLFSPGIAIANTIFSNKLASALRVYAPDAPFELVRRSVEAIRTLPVAQQPGELRALQVVQCAELELTFTTQVSSKHTFWL